MMDFLTDEHRDILKGMKHDRDRGVLKENEYAQERAHVSRMAREEFDAQTVTCQGPAPHTQPPLKPPTFPVTGR